MKHKHYDLIAQWAANPAKWKVETRYYPTHRWVENEFPVWAPEFEYRLTERKPRMMHLNGMEFPAPETEAPATGTRMFAPWPAGSGCVERGRWDGSKYQQRCLSAGLVHLTEEAALAHAKAMLNAKEAV